MATLKLDHNEIQLMVRDVSRVNGFLMCCDTSDTIIQIVLNRAAPLAPCLLGPLLALLVPAHVAVSLGKT